MEKQIILDEMKKAGEKEREDLRNHKPQAHLHIKSNYLTDIAINHHGAEFAFSEAVAVWEKAFYEKED